MTRFCRARTAVLLGVICLLAPEANAQSDGREYSLSSNSRIVGGQHLGGRPLRVEPDGTAREFVQPYQVYREDMAEVEISVSLANTGQDALFFNSGIIERGMRVRLFSMDDATGGLQERAVQVTMRGVIDQDGSGPFITVPDLQLLAEGRGKGVVWIVAVTQLDGRPFTPGRYRFEIELPDIRSAIVTATGGPLPQAALQPWSGVTRGHLELIVTAPSTPAEVAMMYVQRSEVAFDRRQFEEAVALYRQAIDAHPSDAGRTLQLLGGTYLAMGRYAEALPVLQRLPIRVPLVQALLAEAHVGVGDEAEAVDLLRRNGWSEAEVAARIADLQVRVGSRPRR